MAHVMLFPMLNVLYFYCSTFQSMCAVPNIIIIIFIVTSLDACKLECIHQEFVSLCHHHFLSRVDYSYVNVLNYFKLHCKCLEALSRCLFLKDFFYGLK
jgi:hypothetical protein